MCLFASQIWSPANYYYCFCIWKLLRKIHDQSLIQYDISWKNSFPERRSEFFSLCYSQMTLHCYSSRINCSVLTFHLYLEFERLRKKMIKKQNEFQLFIDRKCYVSCLCGCQRALKKWIHKRQHECIVFLTVNFRSCHSQHIILYKLSHWICHLSERITFVYFHTFNWCSMLARTFRT